MATSPFTFPLYTPNPPHLISTINTISTLSQQSPVSYDSRVVPSHFEITSSFHVSMDPIPFLSSSYGEYLTASTHMLQRTKRKGGRHRKRKTNNEAPAYGHHTGHLPLASIDHARGEVPTSSHHFGKKLANGNHAKKWALY